VLADSALALSVLRKLPAVDAERIGMLGHSYGGNTVLFHAPLDDRVRFGCAEVHDLVACMAPRPLLLLSGTDDPYSVDGDGVEAAARPAYEALGAGARLEHARFEGGHPLTPDRAELITSWVGSERDGNLDCAPDARPRGL
jgi:dienelactone hydrolase